MTQPVPQNSVYVGNVSLSATEEVLRSMFHHCGEIRSLRIAGDPSYGYRFAFVEFSSPQQAAMATMLDGMMVYGLPIKVGPYQAKVGSSPTISAPPTPAAPSPPPLAPPGTTPAEPTAPPANATTTTSTNNEERLKRTVYVASCMLEEMTEDEVGAHFGHCGRVLACKKKGKYAWIEFERLESAEVAMSLDGETIGNGILKVMPSRTPILSPSAYKQYPVSIPGGGMGFQQPAAYPYPYPMYPYPYHPYPPPAYATHVLNSENAAQNMNSQTYNQHKQQSNKSS